MTVLFWYWRYGSLQVEVCGSLREAIESSDSGEDRGELSTDRFEIIENGVSREPTEAEFDAVHAAIDAENAAEAAARPPVKWIARSEIQHPHNGESAPYEWYSDMGDAERDLAALRASFGDRVSLREFP